MSTFSLFATGSPVRALRYSLKRQTKKRTGKMQETTKRRLRGLSLFLCERLLQAEQAFEDVFRDEVGRFYRSGLRSTSR